ncbi:MAG: DUF1599 domain-containing protein [Bacteroidetes bacterium]|jgi:hypothetical protein|nr:DUF1599 domain-containing protein [Bacteroidota bacterium]
MADTEKQYAYAISKCRAVFVAKNQDYGPSWRVLRVPSLVDQLYIKAKRMRTIEEKQQQMVDDGPLEECIGLVNYAAMTLVQMELGPLDPASAQVMPFDQLEGMFLRQLETAKALMMKKNHDYGEVWRHMWPTSFTDLIITKLLRIRQIIDNQGQTTISEGIESNLMDIINYAVFAMIKHGETNQHHESNN